MPVQQAVQGVSARDAVGLVGFGGIYVGKADAVFCAVLVDGAYGVAVVYGNDGGGVAVGGLGGGRCGAGGGEGKRGGEK